MPVQLREIHRFESASFLTSMLIRVQTLNFVYMSLCDETGVQ